MDVRVLVVDDHPEVAAMCRSVLEDEGMQVWTAVTPEQTTDMAAEIRPHVILLDIMLDGTSGIELAADLEEAGCALVAMTASEYLADIAEESGLFQAVIAKPFDVDVLSTLICEVAPVEVEPLLALSFHSI